jgi:hypothetical protein
MTPSRKERICPWYLAITVTAVILFKSPPDSPRQCTRALYRQGPQAAVYPLLPTHHTPCSLLPVQLSQHLPRRAQALAVPIDGSNQAPVQLGKLALQNLHILVVFILAPRRLIALHHLNLMRAVLPRRQRKICPRPPRRQARGCLGPKP